MMKKNYSNRFIYLLITLGILALAATGVYAYQLTGTATPSTVGHTSNELNFSTGIVGAGNIFSNGYIHASIVGGNANLVSSTYEISGTNIAGQTIYSYDKICVGNSAGDCSGTGASMGTLLTSTSVSSGSFLYSSDRNLKTNIEPLQNSLSKVLQLQGVSFDWKTTGRSDYGLIAQDVEKVFPELVSGEEGSKSVEYGNLVGVLVEAIKEQQKQIDELKERCR